MRSAAGSLSGRSRLLTGVLLVIGLAAASHARAQPLPVHHETMLVMDDGVELNASVFVPAGSPPEGGWPAIVFVHGFGGSKPIGPAKAAAQRGYVGMAYTVRGQGRGNDGAPSGGFSTVQGPREVADLQTVLEWLKGRYPVHPARVGISGASQGGVHGWMAVSRNLGVAAAVPENFTASIGEAVVLRGGIHSRMVGAGRHVAIAPEIVELRKRLIVDYDAEGFRRWWGSPERDYRAALQQTGIPVMAQFAWEDGWGPANNVIRDFQRLQGPKKLYLGTGGHGSEQVPAEARFRDQWRMRWFDHWLKGENNGILAEPIVEVALLDTWEHLRFSSFPPPRVKLENFYLEGAGRSSGKLVPDSPESYSKRNVFEPRVAPETAITTQQFEHRFAPGFSMLDYYEAGAPLAGPQGLLTRFKLSSVVYDSEPLEHDRLVIGIPELQISVSGSASRYAVCARLWDVGEGNGAKRMFSRASCLLDRGRHRNGHAVALEMSAIAYRLKAGHRLRLELSNLDLDWDTRKQQWWRTWALPFFEAGSVQIHTGAWLFSLLKLPVYPEAPAE